MKIYEFLIGGKKIRYTDKQWDSMSDNQKGKLISQSESLQETYQVNLQDAEMILEKKFKGKHCSLTYPGHEPVYGIVSDISFDTLALAQKRAEVIVIIRTKKFSLSLECLHDCLKLTASGIT